MEFDKSLVDEVLPSTSTPVKRDREIKSRGKCENKKKWNRNEKITGSLDIICQAIDEIAKEEPTSDIHASFGKYLVDEMRKCQSRVALSKFKGKVLVRACNSVLSYLTKCISSHTVQRYQLCTSTSIISCNCRNESGAVYVPGDATSTIHQTQFDSNRSFQVVMDTIRCRCRMCTIRHHMLRKFKEAITSCINKICEISRISNSYFNHTNSTAD